jgi:hypothetical protein
LENIESLSMGTLSVVSDSVELRQVSLDASKDARWQMFVESHPHATIYHHPGWLAALEQEYGQRCIGLACENEAGELRAVLPLFFTKGIPLKVGAHATGRRLSSLPRTPVAGPLALDEMAEASVLRVAVELARSEGVQLEIKSQRAGLDLLVPELACLPWRFTHVTELPSPGPGAPWVGFGEQDRSVRFCGVCEDCERLRFGNAKRHHRVMWAVKKAQKSGLLLRDAEDQQDLREWYRLYLESLRPHAVPPRPFRFFESLWQQLKLAGLLRLLVVEQGERGSRRMVAGSVLLGLGQTEFYAFTGCSPSDFSLHPHDLIQMGAIRCACKTGFRWYDFGEVPEEHEELNQFKGKWGSEKNQMFRYYFPMAPPRSSNPRGRFTSTVREVWRHLPLSATRILGDLIYRFL